MSLILVVEDEAGVAELIAEALTQSNHDVHVAETADDAFTIAKIERVDVILLDTNLHDASGGSTLERLRQVRRDVPIIMLTAKADEELARDMLRHGAFEYVTKPFNLDHLIRVIEFALASSAS
jgi:DNA-binding response OmpR family regulator